LKGLGFGAGGTIGNQQFTGTTRLATTKHRANTFFTFAKGTAPDGLDTACSPQGYYYWGPFGFLGEYVWRAKASQRDRPPICAATVPWQTEGVVRALTG